MGRKMATLVDWIQFGLDVGFSRLRRNTEVFVLVAKRLSFGREICFRIQVFQSQAGVWF